MPTPEEKSTSSNPNPQGELSHEEQIKKLNTMIQNIQFTMLTTYNSKNQTMRSCPMTTQEFDTDGTLWFLTGLKCEHSDEIKENPQVNLSYAEPKDSRYVSITGHAKVYQDQEKAKELWKPVYKAWFPKGLEDPNLGILRVDISKAEFWDSPGSNLVQVLGFVKALATGTSYKPSKQEHQTIQVMNDQSMKA